jgi:thiol-disulfide isomerase/thioredoxin
VLAAQLRLARRRAGVRVALALLVAFSLLLGRASARAADAGAGADAGAECGQGNVCGIDEPVASASASAGGAVAAAPVTLLFFWGVGCPHCEEARPLVEALSREHPALRVEAIEVRRDPEG